MSLVKQLRNWARLRMRNWEPTDDKDCLLIDAADRIVKLEAALQRIANADYPRSVDKIQQIAREALGKLEEAQP